MVTTEMRIQVQVVLRARQHEDVAYRAVMAITEQTSIEEAERLVEEHTLLIRRTRLEEFMLANLAIQAVEKAVVAR